MLLNYFHKVKLLKTAKAEKNKKREFEIKV